MRPALRKGAPVALSLLFACEPAPEAAPEAAIARPSEVAAPASPPERFDLGRAASADEIAAWDIDVDASWNGLPRGRGSVAEGKVLFAQRCAACHAADAKGGKGWLGPPLVATDALDPQDYAAPRGIGNWWPYASTLFDYTRRAMPQTAPGSLTDDETYALVAWMLAENHVVSADFVADQDSLPAVQMTTAVVFVRDARETPSNR